MHPLVRIVVSLLLILLIGFFVAKPSYALFKKWRVTRNLSNAQIAVDESRMQEARDLSLVVLRSGDPGIQAFRILEKSTEALRDPRHSDIARGLIFHEAGSEADKLRGFQGVVMSLPLAPVGQIWASFSAEMRQKNDFAGAFAKRLIAERRWGETAQVLLGVPEEKRDAAWTRQLAETLIGTGNPDGYQEAQIRIDAAMTLEETELSAWVDVLEKIPVLSLQDHKLGRTRAVLGQHREIARYSLMLDRMDYSANVAERSQIIDLAITKWKESDPVTLAAFLRDYGLNDRVVETFSKEMIEAHPGLAQHVVGAWVKSGNWEAVTDFLETPPVGMTEHQALAYQALAATKTGDNATGIRLWSMALEKAKAAGSAEPFLELKRIAVEEGMGDFAEKAMIEAIRMGRGPLPLYSELKPLMMSLKTAERENVILEICAVYLSIEPGNPILLTQYSYMACMTELTAPSAVLEALEHLAKAFPNEPPIQRVLGTVYLIGGRYPEALETLEKAALAGGESPPESLLSLYLARVFAGKMQADDPKITDFPMNSLLPSEKKKFRQLMQASRNSK